jgi:hypothetical protein
MKLSVITAIIVTLLCFGLGILNIWAIITTFGWFYLGGCMLAGVLNYVAWKRVATLASRLR